MDVSISPVFHVVLLVCLERSFAVVAPSFDVSATASVLITWLNAVDTLHTLLVHKIGVVTVVRVSPKLVVRIGHPYMGEITRSDVHPWQLIDLWMVLVDMCTVKGCWHGCGSMVTSVVTQPAATVAGPDLLTALVMLEVARGPDLVCAVTVGKPLGRGCAEKLRYGWPAVPLEAWETGNKGGVAVEGASKVVLGLLGGKVLLSVRSTCVR